MNAAPSQTDIDLAFLLFSTYDLGSNSGRFLMLIEKEDQ